MVRKNTGDDGVRNETQLHVFSQQIGIRSFPDKPGVVTCHFTPFHVMSPPISNHRSEMFGHFHLHQSLFSVKERDGDNAPSIAGQMEMQEDTAYLTSITSQMDSRNQNQILGPLTSLPGFDTCRLVSLPCCEGKLSSTVLFSVRIARTLHVAVEILNG